MRLTALRRPSVVLLAGLPLAAGLAACGSSSGSADDAPSHAAKGGGKKLSVVASTNVWGDVAKQVAGDRATITSIISDPGQDPHSYEADTRNQLALSRASVVVANGGGYDDFVGTMLKSAKNTDARVVDAVQVSGKKAPAGGELNEHVWYDFPTVAKVADRIAGALGKADPGHAGAYRSNAAAFAAKLKKLEAREAAIKKDHKGASIAITEPVPLYMTEAAGLVNRTPEDLSEAVEEGDDVPPKALSKTLGLFTGKKVEALVYNDQTSDAATAKIKKAAHDNGEAVVPVTETVPAGKTYLSWMTGNLDALAAALEG